MILKHMRNYVESLSPTVREFLNNSKTPFTIPGESRDKAARSWLSYFFLFFEPKGQKRKAKKGAKKLDRGQVNFAARRRLALNEKNSLNRIA